MNLIVYYFLASTNPMHFFKFNNTVRQAYGKHLCPMLQVTCRDKPPLTQQALNLLK